ncbi:DUF4252 domain-containing protein [Flavobacterium sp. 20NA77.7]|uniref:DUF4252 domain-containing protein n=1 Tax=Flavobacterium nakdongensis TaxID=3073563 RepID=A0ABY9RD50_9FLAO|nr:DUF4252 domain-containing protein [Flavobacterium sp. 20NA77.7]WMW78555.1 DUF4252 domain-containing protein [Flavobacterium sp. 20NA77.7]
MKNFFILLLVLGLTSCEEKTSLQKYFVKSAENKNFIAVDVSSSLFNIDTKKLTPSEKEALASFDKVNVIAFKKDGKNNAAYHKEMQEVKTLLKDTVFQPLIKLNGKGKNASIMVVDNAGTIDELVLFGNKNDLGFTVVRVLGNDMKPENAMEFLKLLQKSSINIEQLQPVLNIVATKKETKQK